MNSITINTLEGLDLTGVTRTSVIHYWDISRQKKIEQVFLNFRNYLTNVSGYFIRKQAKDT